MIVIGFIDILTDDGWIKMEVKNLITMNIVSKQYINNRIRQNPNLVYYLRDTGGEVRITYIVKKHLMVERKTWVYMFTKDGWIE